MATEASVTVRLREKGNNVSEKRNNPSVFILFQAWSVMWRTTHKDAYKNGCFTLEKRCFTDWQLVFKQGSGHLQSYFLLLQQCKGRRESHLVFQEFVRCCTISTDNWNCTMTSFLWIMNSASCNSISFMINSKQTLEIVKQVIGLPRNTRWGGVRAPSLTKKL